MIERFIDQKVNSKILENQQHCGFTKIKEYLQSQIKQNEKFVCSKLRIF